jgi:MinD superfamily P-loop ATPase
MKIAVASGKGGTGKTTVSILLFHYIEKWLNESVRLVDCDVEEPNDALFFSNKILEVQKEVTQIIPEIDINTCTFCRKCADWCEFNAITIVKTLNFAEIDSGLCHSCGACLFACKFGAISESNKPLGTILHYETKTGLGLTEGRLQVGSAMQTSLIKKVKKEQLVEAEVVIFDAPPGTSCPVVETVSDADYVILVTEPTPFGLHDLKITVELLLELQKPFGVIINKSGLGNNDVHYFLKSNNIDLLGKIPFSKVFAEGYSKGKILENIPAELEEMYQNMIRKLEIKLAVL